MGIEIEKKLTEAGYSMFGDEETMGELILNILKTKNTRYLKAIPFLIYKHMADINRIYQLSKNNKLFQAIIAITARLANEFDILLVFPEELEENLEKYFDEISKSGLNYNEFKDEFELQLRNQAKPSLLIDKQKIYEERNIQFSLSQLFTKKEKLIIKRLLHEKPISRTDYEYYSRKTRKKLRGIINLEDFAKTIYSRTPKCDEDLYNLKKKLEELIEKDSDISIQEFSLRKNKDIFISYKKKNDLSSKGKLHNTIIKLGNIKDTKLMNLINNYKKHNFG